MAIQLASDDASLIEEDSTYTFRQLMDKLYIEGDIILTVPDSQVESLKRGMIMRKSKDNRSAKTAGALPVASSLKFNVYPATAEDGKVIVGQTCVRVSLDDRKGINVIKMEVPTDEL